MYDLLILLLCGAVVWLYVQLRELKEQINDLREGTAVKPTAAHAKTKPAAAKTEVAPKPQIAKRPIVEQRDAPKPPPLEPSHVERALNWVQENWVLAVAGVSLVYRAKIICIVGHNYLHHCDLLNPTFKRGLMSQ